MWSCGVIAYVLLSGMKPFNGTSDQEVFRKIKSGRFDFKNAIWNGVSKEA